MINQPVSYTPNYYQPAQQGYYPQAPAQEYNAIKINIVDPKVLAPGSQAPVYNPYNYPQSSVYYPTATQAPVYSDPNATPAPVYTAPQPSYYPPVMPQQYPQAPQVVNQQQVYQTPPSVMPPTPQLTQPAPAVVPPVTQQPQTAGTVDVAGLTNKIKSSDLQTVNAAIESVADIAQTKPEAAPQLLDIALMESLLGVIGQDTSALTGPTKQQDDLRQQVLEGKKLSDADLALANEITPAEMAERNKQYALFTVAILQNALIDEFKKTNNMTPDIKDLPGMEQIVTTIKDNPNPMLRASGLAALAYNARQEYKPVMQEIFQLSTNDADENVKKVANDGLAKLNEIR
jgi:hypothetical protein